MSIQTNYLGLTLKSPVIVASSPFTMTPEKIQRLCEHGAGAVVLKSIFEEQILGETAYLEKYNDYPEAADYLKNYVSNERVNEYIDLIRQVKSTADIPVIASINCHSAGSWVDFAQSVQDAGCDALELNIYLLPSDLDQSAEEIERQYYDIVARVTSLVSIPVSVKLGMRFTNILAVSKELYYRKAQGLVLFNRFFEPDIDIDHIHLSTSDSVSSHTELRNSLRTVAQLTSRLPQLDIAVSTGVHSGADVVKSLLVGAKAVEVCSALYLHGLEAINEMNGFLAKWMDDHTFGTVEEFRGRMREDNSQELYQRVQYMKFFPKL